MFLVFSFSDSCTFCAPAVTSTMMISLFVFLISLAMVTAFAPTPFVRSTRITRLSMFDPGERNPEPLETVTDTEVTTTTELEQPRKMLVKNLGFGKGGEVKEVNFIDPAMSANTNPLQMNWWA